MSVAATLSGPPSGKQPHVRPVPVSAASAGQMYLVLGSASYEGGIVAWPVRQLLLCALPWPRQGCPVSSGSGQARSGSASRLWLTRVCCSCSAGAGFSSSASR